jgi:PAS domain S-box-containing protein
MDDPVSALTHTLGDRVAELETVFRLAPVAIAIAADRECRVIRGNPAMAAVLGTTADANISLTALPGEAEVSYRVLDAAGGEIAPDQLPMQVAAREGRPVTNVEVDIVRADGQVVRLIQHAVPLFDEQQRTRGAVAAFIDITERRQAELRTEFLLRLDEAMQQLVDPVAILSTATMMLGEHLRVARCAYAEVDEDADHFSIPHEYHDGSAEVTLVGEWRLSQFGAGVAERLRSGQTLVVSDYQVEWPAEAPAFTSLGIRASIAAAAVRGGRLYAMMAVHQASPRGWEPGDIALVETVAERCWDSIERARAARRLAASELRYRNLFHSMNDGFCACELLVDEQGRPQDYRFLEVNDAFESHTGLVDAAGHTALELVPGLERHWIDLYGSVALSRAPIRFEQNSEAMQRYFDVQAFPFGQEGSLTFGILFTDITERRLTERRLRQSEARFRRMADLMPQLVWTAHADGRVDYYSARAGAYDGIRVDDGGMQEWQPLVHPDDRAATVAAWREAVDRIQPYAFEHRLQMADGQYRWHLSRAEPVERGAADAIRWVGTATDIHDLRVTQEALRVQEERLLAVDRRKDEFLAILAHELRNPLAPLRTGLELLRRGADGETAERLRAMMERQVAHMVRLIDDLLDVSRISSGQIPLRREVVSVEELIRQTLEAHQAAIDQAGLRFSVALPEAPVRVAADSARFIQVLSNLLHNAIKFTPPGGAISLSGTLRPASGGPGDLALTIRDTGPGLPPERMPGLFDLFNPGTLNGEMKPGLGIGLALSRRLMELHGGTLNAEPSAPGDGAAFTLTLPLTDLGPLPPPAVAEVSAGQPLRGRRVLVVDDNQDGADALAMLLTYAGADVRVVYDGPAALTAVPEFHPDSVLLDIGLPGMDGHATCQALRALPGGTQIAVVALTGFGQEHDKQRARAAGFDAHLTKPVDLDAVSRLLLRIGPA